jgi:hypothetical protein
MPKNALDLVDDFLSDDQRKWGKLASDIAYRRLELLMLREILLELRKLTRDSVNSQ